MIEVARNRFNGEVTCRIGRVTFDGRARFVEYVTLLETLGPDGIEYQDGPRRWNGVVSGFPDGALRGLSGEHVELILAEAQTGIGVLLDEDGNVTGTGPPPWLPLA